MDPGDGRPIDPTGSHAKIADRQPREKQKLVRRHALLGRSNSPVPTPSLISGTPPSSSPNTWPAHPAWGGCSAQFVKSRCYSATCCGWRRQPCPPQAAQIASRRVRRNRGQRADRQRRRYGHAKPRFPQRPLNVRLMRKSFRIRPSCRPVHPVRPRFRRCRPRNPAGHRPIPARRQPTRPPRPRRHLRRHPRHQRRRPGRYRRLPAPGSPAVEPPSWSTPCEPSPAPTVPRRSRNASGTSWIDSKDGWAVGVASETQPRKTIRWSNRQGGRLRPRSLTSRSPGQPLPRRRGDSRNQPHCSTA